MGEQEISVAGLTSNMGFSSPRFDTSFLIKYYCWSSRIVICAVQYQGPNCNSK